MDPRRAPARAPTRLALGPLRYNWPRQAVLDFHAALAAPLPVPVRRFQRPG